ncbi:NERD domain-containing protein [uncultured Clostridium sp.]|uniref:NERD domain-containing protein n=1 Tax=uncultured Clostridium sp. TaxID=59620 RepID=UPI002610E3EF|nr:NERD domain-containing protein [uncultured Clostridium sp.]
MGILKNIIGIKEIKSPIFYKEFKENIEAEQNLLKLIEETKDRDTVRDIKSEIYAMKKGAKGESDVAYELKNSYVPMICLHDIRLEFEDKVAQFDFIILTHYFIMVLETKALSCDVNINQYGEFERVIRLKNGNYYKKGMYSPISQNARHVRILKDFLSRNNKLLKKLPIHDAVIMANKEAVINRRYARKEDKEKIYKIDQITNLLETTIQAEKKTGEVFESKIINIANILLENNKPIDINYRKKFRIEKDIVKKEAIVKEDTVKEEITEEQYNREVEQIVKKLEGKIEHKEVKDKEIRNREIRNKEIRETLEINEDLDQKLREKLIAYRKKCFMEEKIKPYFVFKNKAMENIIEAKPKNIDELKKVNEVGENTVKKYGNDIIKIINDIN